MRGEFVTHFRLSSEGISKDIDESVLCFGFFILETKDDFLLSYQNGVCL